jgi:hypothetical protein
MHGLTRREALRRGGIVTAGVALGAAATSGSAGADGGRTGGTMLLLSEPLLGVPFTATDTFEFEFPVSCFASESALEGFQELVVAYANGDEALAAVRTGRRQVDRSGGTAYAFASSTRCRDSASPTGATVWQAAFRPA